MVNVLTEDGPWLADALLAVRLAGFVGRVQRSAVWCALACNRGAPDTTDCEKEGCLQRREGLMKAAEQRCGDF